MANEPRNMPTYESSPFEEEQDNQEPTTTATFENELLLEHPSTNGNTQTMMSGGIRKSITTALRCSQDIWFRPLASPQNGGTLVKIFPHTALHMFDHHLHASGIIPKSSINNATSPQQQQQQPPGRIYDHDWVCVSQAVNCYNYPNLLEESVSTNATTKTHIWVTSVGNSSLHFGNLLTLDDTVLASSRRVYVRLSQQGGTAAPFTEMERERLEQECALDETIQEYLERQPAGSSVVELPTLQKFGTFLPVLKGNDKKPVLTVRVGPQHTNMACHADHAFLASTAVQALEIANLPFIQSVAVNYISEVLLGQELNCFLHEDRIYVMKSEPENSHSKPELALVAKTI